MILGISKLTAFLSINLAWGSMSDYFHSQLHGKEELDIPSIYSKYLDENISAVDATEEGRFEIFSQKIQDIVRHNTDPTVTYTKGINPYTAMTAEEVRAYFRLQEMNEEQQCSATTTKTSNLRSGDAAETMEEPDSWDWRDHNGVSPVKDQGPCGSCWTFSTVGCLESAHLIKYDELVLLSEQQLVDCAGAFKNDGCNGGLPSHAFEYIYYNGGIATSSSYPYDATDHECTVDPNDYVIEVVDGSVNITAGDEDLLRQEIYNYGPVSVAFQVVDDFVDYESGVYTSTSCRNTQDDVNHAVLAVGYGTDEDTGLDYWTVKNSWSEEWGDGGFFKIERGVNMCGMAVCNSHPRDISKVDFEEEIM